MQRPLAITFNGIDFTPLVNGTFDAHAAFASASVENGVVTGKFLPANDGLPSFVLADVTGVLLSGKYFQRSIAGALGSTQGTSDSTFQATGGSLESFFGGDGLINFDLFNVTPPFSQNSFASNFNSQFAGIIAPVPEPSRLSLVLLCLGSVCVAGFAWVNRGK